MTFLDEMLDKDSEIVLLPKGRRNILSKIIVIILIMYFIPTFTWFKFDLHRKEKILLMEQERVCKNFLADAYSILLLLEQSDLSNIPTVLLHLETLLQSRTNTPFKFIIVTD